MKDIIIVREKIKCVIMVIYSMFRHINFVL